MQYSRIVVVGSVAFDQIMNIPGVFADHILPDKIDELNVSFTANNLKKEFGGTGANCAVAISRLGLKTELISCFGKDGEEYKDFLRSMSIGMDGCMTLEKLHTALGSVLTDMDGNQIWSFYSGAMKESEQLDLSKTIKKNDLVALLPVYPMSMGQLTQQLVELGADFLFDPAFYIPQMSVDELRLGVEEAKYIIGNSYEISLIEEKLKSSKRDWLKEGNRVIETRGREGVVIYSQDGEIEVKATTVDDAVDPTGAGDAFRAGFLVGQYLDKSLLISGQIGAVSAAYAIEVHGTQNAAFSIESFSKRYEKNYNSSLSLNKS